MKIVKAFAILAVILLSTFTSCSLKLRRYSKTKTQIKFDKEAAKTFAGGAAAAFIGIDPKCIMTVVEKEELKLPTTVHTDLLGVVKSILIVRQQIFNYFEGKFKEWDDSKRAGLCSVYKNTLGRLVSSDFVDEKAKRYADKVKKYSALRDRAASAYNNVISLFQTCTGPISDRNMPTVLTSIQIETNSLFEDLKEFMAAFGKKGFADVVDVKTISPQNMPFANESDLGELKGLCNAPPTAWEEVKNTFISLKSYYDRFASSTVGCIGFGVKGVVALVQAVLSTTTLFVPGLNILSIIWRAVNLAIYFAKAIYNLYQGSKETVPLKKWELYGASFGNFMRGIVYLITGAKKKKALKKN